MTEPLVCAIMLTRDRPAMARRALESFRAQTYDNKLLLVWDTGEEAFRAEPEMLSREWHICAARASIGGMRNRSAAWLREGPTPWPEIIIHWDDDDRSHPNRIAEQVALLQSSGADAVGYSDLLFWRNQVIGGYQSPHEGEAWLYSSTSPRPMPLGTSLCYWRKTWEARPFPEFPQPHDKSVNCGEDYEWCRGLNVATVSSMERRDIQLATIRPIVLPFNGEPRMIASIHGGNTSPAYRDLKPPEWTRVPEWDSWCRERMAL